MSNTGRPATKADEGGQRPAKDDKSGKGGKAAPQKAGGDKATSTKKSASSPAK